MVDFNLGSLQLTDTKNATITLFASSALRLPTKGITHIEGNISSIVQTYHPVVEISPDKLAQRVNTQAHAPADADTGVYVGKFYVYNRPLWALLPIQHIESMLNTNYFLNIMILELISNLIVAGAIFFAQLLCITIFNYLADTAIWHYDHVHWLGWKLVAWYDKGKSHIVSNLSRIQSTIHWSGIRSTIDSMSFEPPSSLKSLSPALMLCAFPSITGNIVISLILTSCVTAVYYVAWTKRAWFADLSLIAVFTSIISTALYMGHWIVTRSIVVTVWSVYALVAPAVTIILMGLLVSGPFVYVTAYLLLKCMARVPGRSLNVIGDWDVVP
jgi:hypothetical protein